MFVKNTDFSPILDCEYSQQNRIWLVTRLGVHPVAAPSTLQIKCPKCDYTGRNRQVILLHYGLTHRVVVRYIDEAIKKDPSLAVATPPVR